MINPLKIKGSYNVAWKLVSDYMKQVCENLCQNCGIENTKLQVHHINRCPLDNRIENLALLCPQCHQGLKHRRGVSKVEPWWRLKLKKGFRKAYGY